MANGSVIGSVFLQLNIHKTHAHMQSFCLSDFSTLSAHLLSPLSPSSGFVSSTSPVNTVPLRLSYVLSTFPLYEVFDFPQTRLSLSNGNLPMTAMAPCCVWSMEAASVGASTMEQRETCLLDLAKIWSKSLTTQM